MPHFFNPGHQPRQALYCPHSRLGGCWACSAGGARNLFTTTPEAQVHQSGLRKPFSFARANALSYKTTRKRNWIATRVSASSSLLTYKEAPPAQGPPPKACAVAPAPGITPLTLRSRTLFSRPPSPVLPDPLARKLTCRLVPLRQFALLSSSVRREL